MRIGEVSQCSGVSVRMLRHYDSLGLVRPSGRTSAGYREYADEDLRRSLHLEALRSLGLSLAQAGRALNGGEESDDTTTSDPAAVLDALIARTRERLDAEHELLTLLADTRDRAPRDRDEVLATIALLRAVHSDDPGTGPHPRDRPDRTTRDGRLVRAPRPRSPGRHQWSDRTRTRPGGDRVDAAAAHARMFDALDQLSPILDPLADLFAQRGFELALVGGSVRDALLGRDMPDLDFTTDARPDDILAAIRGWADAHWDIGKQFGTIGLRKGDRLIEITTYRAEQYDPDSRKPVVAFGDTLDADLVRRDFTIGAMAVRLPGRVFVDPHGGLSDLAAGVIRTPGTPEDSFSDDPLRMMRGARFTSQLDFRVATEVRDAMTRMSDRIDIISAERVRDELVKLVTGLRPRAGIELLVETGICERILPEFAALRDQQDEHNRHKDVYEHSLTVLDQAVELEKEYARRDAEAAAEAAATAAEEAAENGAGEDTPAVTAGPEAGGPPPPARVAGDGSADDAAPSTPPFTSPDFIVRFAALMHDVGKPRTRRFDSSGGVTFHHHDVVGAKMTAKRMRALAFDKDTLTKVARLVELHLRFYGYGDAGWTDSAVRRYVTDSGDLLTRLHILTRSDVTTRNRRKANRLARNYDELEQRIAALAEKEALDAIRPELDGTRIMEILDIPPGPLVGQAYRFLLELRLEEGVVGEEEAALRLRAWHADGAEASS